MGSWPPGADGDVFRRLEGDGCDFSSQHVIDFYIDFADWPPRDEAIALLKAEFDSVKLLDQDDKQTPCVMGQIEALLTYEFVTGKQAKITGQMQPFGGVCSDWGVMI
jgi:hypothetical protein